MALMTYVSCQVCAGSNKRLGTRRRTKKEISSEICTTLPVERLALICENDKTNCRVLLFYLPEKIDTAAIAQLNIENDNRRLVLRDNAARFGDGVSLTDIFQGGHAFEHCKYPLLQWLRIVDD